MTITFTALTSGSSDGRAALALTARGYATPQTAGRGRCRLALRASGLSYSTADGVADPIVPAHGLVALAIKVAGQSYSTNVGNGEAVLGLAAQGYDGNASAGGRLRLALATTGRAWVGAGAYGLMVDRAPVITADAGLWIENLSDAVTTATNLSGLQTAVLKAALAAAATSRGARSTTVATMEEIAFGASLSILWHMLLEEGITLSGVATDDGYKVTKVVARLLLSGEVDTYAEAIAAVTVGLVFGALTDLLAFEQITDQVQLAAVVSELFTAVEAMLETVIAASAAEGSQIAVALVNEDVVMASALAGAAELNALINEGIGFFLTLNLDDGNYIAWVLNTESKGLSRYTNYPFNSFMRVGRAYYGVTSTGLYKLSGDDDAGTPIAAKLRLGMSDLGTRKLKRLPEGYIGYTSDGTLLLQVIFSDEATGEKNGAYYTLPPRAAGNVRENRWKVGKGLKSVDWDFEITNVDGADFDLQSIQWRPIILDRRTRG